MAEGRDARKAVAKPRSMFAAGVDPEMGVSPGALAAMTGKGIRLGAVGELTVLTGRTRENAEP
jgi:hypothetical protein